MVGTLRSVLPIIVVILRVLTQIAAILEATFVSTPDSLR